LYHLSHFLFFFFQIYSELAEDLIFINFELQEPSFGDIPLLSSRPQGVTPSPAKRRRKSALTFTTPPTASMPVQKRGATIQSPPVSIMKPAAERHMSMEDLNESAARMGLTDHQMNVGGVSIPILRGSWKKKIRADDDEGGFVTTFKDYNLIRMLPHSSIALKQCEPIWLNSQQLRIGIVWPKWFKSAKQQVAFQTTGSAHKFDEDHDVIDSLQHDINRKQESKKDKKTRVVDYAIFEFELPQDTSKAATEITILKVTLEAADLDTGEELPPGGQVKVLQIITQQKMEGDEENLLDVTQRDVNLGNYKLNQFELNCMYRHASHFYSSSFFIGKSDPDGTKAGDAVDMNVVKRLNDFFDSHFRKEGVYSNDDMILFLKPFIGREEAVLQLTLLLYKNGEESTYDVERIMNAFPAGKEDEMHAYVQTQLDKKKQQAAIAEKAKAAHPPSTDITTTSAANLVQVPTDITTTTTTTTTGPPTFWGAEAGTAVVPDGWDDDLSMSSALFEDIAKPHAADDIEVDHELAVHNKEKEHVQNRIEADHEKEASVKEKAGNKLSRITRQTSKRKVLEN
jgi:hypothetical protein